MLTRIFCWVHLLNDGSVQYIVSFMFVASMKSLLIEVHFSFGLDVFDQDDFWLRWVSLSECKWWYEGLQLAERDWLHGYYVMIDLPWPTSGILTVCHSIHAEISKWHLAPINPTPHGFHRVLWSGIEFECTTRRECNCLPWDEFAPVMCTWYYPHVGQPQDEQG